MQDDTLSRLVALFQILADPARLRILSAVAERPQTGRDLSQRLGLSPPTISHHVAKLTAAGLLLVTPAGTRRSYSLDTSALQAVSRDLAHPLQSTPSAAPEADSEQAKVVRDFFAGERLKQIPAQRKKRVVVLRHLLVQFDPGREYPEREVNDLLRPAHDDVATLRRELVDYGFLTRSAGVYRVAASLPPRGPTVRQEIPANEDAWLRDLIARATAHALIPGDDGHDRPCPVSNAAPPLPGTGEGVGG